MARSILDRALTAIIVAAAINVLYLCWQGTYDVRIGPLHLVAHGIYKPLLILQTAFFLCLLVRRPQRQAIDAPAPRWLWLGIAAIGALWLAWSIPVYSAYHEWTYSSFSAGLRGWSGVAKLFTLMEEDAWYRPVGFLSLWIDHKVFGAALWGYHLQNVAWHMASAYLVYAIARRWKWAGRDAAWAALLFASGAFAFEPAMWPAARFDSIAMAFFGWALLLATNYLAEGGETRLAATLVLFAISALTKESGYAFVLVSSLLAWRAPSRPRVRLLIGGVLLTTAALLAVRWAVVGGIGGYAQQGQSDHLTFTPSTLQGVLVKLAGTALFTLNHSEPVLDSMRWIVALLALQIVFAAWRGAAIVREHRVALLHALLCAVPVLTLLGWMGPTAQNTRYVYMPSAFLLMAIVPALAGARHARYLLSTLLMLNLAAGAHNVRTYRDTYEQARALAASLSTAATAEHATEVRVLHMPGEFNGVFFSRAEMELAFAARMPGVTLNVEAADCGSTLCFEWNPEARDLRRLRE